MGSRRMSCEGVHAEQRVLSSDTIQIKFDEVTAVIGVIDRQPVRVVRQIWRNEYGQVFEK